MRERAEPGGQAGTRVRKITSGRSNSRSFSNSNSDGRSSPFSLSGARRARSESSSGGTRPGQWDRKRLSVLSNSSRFLLLLDFKATSDETRSQRGLQLIWRDAYLRAMPLGFAQKKTNFLVLQDRLFCVDGSLPTCLPLRLQGGAVDLLSTKVNFVDFA